MMGLKLVIADRRPEHLAIWADVFRGEAGVSCLLLDPKTLGHYSGLDAELMPSSLAHSRYGGKQIMWEAQILSSKGESGTPPWVVTTPPVPARFEPHRQPDGQIRLVAVKNHGLSESEETFFAFSKVFSCISHWNQSGEGSRICMLGFSLELLNSPQGDPVEEARQVLKAYQPFSQ